MLVIEYTDTFGETHEKFISVTGETPKEILDNLVVKGKVKHTLLEIKAIEFFKSKGEEVIGVEVRTEAGFFDIVMRDQTGVKVFTECKHGYEPNVDPDQIKAYFSYLKSQMSGGERVKMRLFIGNDVTSPKVKEYVKCAIELHEETEVPFEVYIKGELKSLDEVKGIVEG
ncbi:MAG: hypothetical protein FGF50_11305 [Candidatus Brockarchaeota archaeon]|nr:hypothetical protein [Candidatus Brockarchaeota archaeon]